jgi:hypothetical protein
MGKRETKNYPKWKGQKLGQFYCGFLNLRGVKPKAVKDTILVYEDDGFELMINVDIDKKDRPVGVEIIYREGGKI